MPKLDAADYDKRVKIITDHCGHMTVTEIAKTFEIPESAIYEIKGAFNLSFFKGRGRYKSIKRPSRVAVEATVVKFSRPPAEYSNIKTNYL